MAQKLTQPVFGSTAQPYRGKDIVKLLGLTVKDRVTDAEGICTSVSFDLYGCTQIWITPKGATKQGESAPGAGWYDSNRVIVTSSVPVMPQPDFVAEIGPEVKGPPLR